MKRLVAFFVLLGLTSCASIEGTRDKSFTLKREQLTTKITSIAILPVKENAVQVGLASQIEDALYFSLLSNLRGVNIVNSEEFKKLVAQNEKIERFGQWLAGYEATSIVNGKELRDIRASIGVDHFLLVRSISLTREKIRGVDAGYSGWVSDAKNVYRSDLKIYAELIDLVNGQLVWKGVGHAENINSPRKDLNLLLVIDHEKEPGIRAFLDGMIKTATAGVARELHLFSQTYRAGSPMPPPQAQLSHASHEKAVLKERVSSDTTAPTKENNPVSDSGVRSVFGGIK